MTSRVSSIRARSREKLGNFFSFIYLFYLFKFFFFIFFFFFFFHSPLCVRPSSSSFFFLSFFLSWWKGFGEWWEWGWGWSVCTSGNIPLCQSLADPISQHLQAVKHGLALLFFVQAFLCPRARCTPTYARTATHNPTCTNTTTSSSSATCAATTTTADSQLPCQPLRQRDELNQEKVETGRVEERRVRVRGGVCRDGRVEGHAGWAGLGWTGLG